MNELKFLEMTLRDLAVFVRAKYADRSGLQVNAKSNPNDLLTEVDLAVQRMGQERIAHAYPGDLFIAEEEGLGVLPEDHARRCWIMDPIDGTQNFVRGLFPAFGVSLAFVEGGRVQAGGVIMAMTGDLFLAGRGVGTFRNGRRVQVSEVARLDVARVEVDFSGPVQRPYTVRATHDLMIKAGQLRCHCAAVVGLCSIASGDADAYFCWSLRPWDYAAGLIIVEEAGGVVTHMDGSPVDVLGPRSDVIASNGLIHEEYVAALLPGE